MRLRLPELNLPVGRKRQPEDSVALRAWVLAAILVGEVAVLTSGYFDPATGILVPLLTVVAFVVSHRRRREKNFFIKVMLAFAALAALAVFSGRRIRRCSTRGCRSRGCSSGYRSYTPSICPRVKTSGTRS